MNCREAEHQIFAERDGALDETRRAALATHLAQCPGCQRMRENLATALDALRTHSQQVRVPDAELEWQKLRREIRGSAGSKSAMAEKRRSPLAWLGLPLAAAAAIAITLSLRPVSDPAASGEQARTIAKAEAPSTVVFVDDQSGYLFVWADETKSL